ncbi:dual specificity protein phosphatase 14-like [Oppia nitens]|uniref:dual specificity protein phosphatase 14-like n=1 Tax=Oppia nitens TaxID=1686743 RepID=UPI0023DAA694|nr:dual specificity protein phosphatase 14-like [Oppia nitens]
MCLDFCNWCWAYVSGHRKGSLSSSYGSDGRDKRGQRLSLLARAAQITHTTNSVRVNRKVVSSLPTREQQQLDKIDWPIEWRYAYSRPFVDVSPITETIFLSSAGAVNVDNVRDYDIKCIVSVTHETPVLAIDGLEFIRIPVEDTDEENIGQYFDELSDRLSALSAKNSKSLIHCQFGKSRAPTVVIAHLMKSHRMSLNDAFDLVKTRRPFIGLNDGFIKQLIQYEQRLFGHQLTNVATIKQKNRDKESSKVWLAKYESYV